MTQKDFLSDDLFIYWRLNPSQELDAYWNRFINENSHLKAEFDSAIGAFDAVHYEKHMYPYEEAEVKKKLQAKIQQYRKRKTFRIYYISSAVAVCLLVLISLFFVKNNTASQKTLQTSIGEVMSEDEIVLLTGEDVVTIDNNTNVDLSNAGNSAIIQQNTTQKNVKLAENELNKLIVPFGKRTELTLSDGSKVYLNSGTEMEFPSAFTRNKREITVKGEIFIEVTKQTAPFIIHTPKSQINVYGTSFNVSAYAEDETESVALVSGSVKVASNNQTLMLKPNQLAQIKDGSIQSKTVDVSEYISWKNGYIQLNKTPLNDVLKKIGRYYNIKFVYSSDLNLHTKTCTGKLFLAEDLIDVLTSFSKMTSLKYQKHENNTISISVQNTYFKLKENNNN